MSAFTYLIWLLLVVGAGWAAWPLAARALGAALPDCGLAVGRLLFLSAWTMLAFWLGQFGVSVAMSAWLYLPLALIGIAFGWHGRAQLRDHWRQHRKTIVATEVLFVLVFTGFFGLRGFWSDTSGFNGEKSMDSALIGSLARAEKLPPLNPYSAGARLQSYYYFGHLETALLTRASGTSVRWSYNLMCATLPALCFGALFSLGVALTKSHRGGAWVAGAVLAGGTLQPLYQWSHLDIYSTGRPFALNPFDISRVIPFTINEFPWFTFNQADLHGHYFDFPNEIALMTLSWCLYRAKNIGSALLAALVLGAMLITNTWDFPAFGLLIGLAIIASNNETIGIKPTSASDVKEKIPPSKARAKNKGKGQKSVPESGANAPIQWKTVALPFLLKLAKHIMFSLGIMLLALLLASPFLRNIQSAASPPQRLQQPASPLREWLLLWGPIAGCWWFFSGYQTFRESVIWRATLALIVVGIAVGAVYSAWGTPSVLVLPIIAASAGLAIVGAVFNRGKARFLCLLALCGIFALAWGETTWAGFLGSADHIGFDDYKRQDTAFKFGLQTWMLWGTASATGLWLVVAQGSRALKNMVRIVILPLALVMIIGNLSFTMMRVRFLEMATAQRAGKPDWLRFDGWDGWAHLAPPEKEAATWLLQSVRPGDNIVEAEMKDGGDYTDFTRYADATGIPTIVGPQSHSFQWSPANAPMGHDEAGRATKGGIEWSEVYRRKMDVRHIYGPINNLDRVQILQSYGVKYLIWGELERREYGEENFANIAALPVATQFGAPDDPHRVTIFRVE